MKYLQAHFLLLALAARSAFAEFTYSVTATQNGKPVPASDIVLERVEPSLHRLNRTSDAPATPAPKGRPSSAKARGRGVQRRTNSIYYSSNWCGAVQSTVSTNPITSVHAYFQVPTLAARPGVTSYPQFTATWVGIDGASWQSALLQSGVTSQLSSSGVQTNWAWLEWIPDAAINIPSFPVATGDWIEVTVSATNSTSGSIAIANLDQDTSYLIPLNNGTPLGRLNAEWILEDPATGGGLAPLARFSDTWFEECTVSTHSGATKNVDAATMYYLSASKCTSSEYDSGDFWVSSS